MSTDSKAVAKTTPKAQIRDLLQSEEFKLQVARALPKAMSPERFARIALNATFRNPKLLNCTRETFLRCCMELSAIGLEPDGRRAHLVPFMDKRSGNLECTLIIDYKGIAELVRRHGDVSHIHCDVVGENDVFDYRFGTGGKLEHVPAINDRGRIYCAYSYVRLKDGSEEFDVMGLEDIERIRKRSRSGDDGPWVSDWNEMAKKTVFRRHSKTLPLSADLRDAIEQDDQAFTEQERFSAARPATVSVASSPRLPRTRETKRTETNFEDHEEESAPSLPPPPSESEAAPEKVADVPPTPVAAAAPQPPTLADQVAELIANEGYTLDELLDVLRDVKLIGSSVESLAQCPPKALQTVLNDWDNCKRRLDSKKVAA